MKEIMKDITKYQGVFPAFYACYDAEGNISVEGVKALTRHLIAKGVKGVYVGGSSGECIYQHVDERKTVLEAVMSEAKGKITVIAHVGCNNTAGKWKMDVERMLEQVDENTIVVVPTFGVTYTGAYEFPADIAKALDDYEAKTGINIDIHVDGASGAFLAPFCAPDIAFDFRVPRVKSISTSGHKYGLAPLGCGWVVWRDTSELPEGLIFNVNYLGGEIPNFAINFSRPAGQIICQYYDFIRLGKEGYTNIHTQAYDVAQYISSEIAKLGPYEFICTGDPKEGIPAACFFIKDGQKTNYTLFDLSDKLRTRGWQVPAFTLPADCQDTVVMRVMVRQGFSKDLADLFLEDYKRMIDFFEKHPVTSPMTAEEGTSFHHS